MPPAQEPQIPPRQPGESVYAYRNRRSVALSGKTLYQKRKEAGLARGLTVSEARGHAPAGGVTEYQRRRQRTIQQTGLTPNQLWRNQQQAWLITHGFTPQSTGWSWDKLIKAAPWLRYLNNHASPGAEIIPDMILEATDLEISGVLESEWSYNRLYQRYQSTREYVEAGDPALGRYFYFYDRIPEMPTAWWFYH